MKISKLDAAIANLEAERAVIDLAIAKLRAQQAHQPTRIKKPRVHPVEMMNRAMTDREKEVS